MKRLSASILIVSCLVGLQVTMRAAQAGGEARYFRVRSQRDFLAGTLSGIAVDPMGRLSLADRVDRLADLGEPFLFSIAEHPRGWVVGTGNSGNVLMVSRDGGVRDLVLGSRARGLRRLGGPGRYGHRRNLSGWEGLSDLEGRI